MDKEKNYWKTATIFLFMIVIFLIVYNLYEMKNNLGTDESLCMKITNVPAWISSEGEIISYGVVQEPNSDYDSYTDLLIDNKIKLLYTSSCSACEYQLELLGEENMNRLEENNLAVNCQEILK